MTTFDAVYRGGALHPLFPLGLAEGTPVRLTVVPDPPASPPDYDPKAVYERIMAIAALSDPNASPENVSGNVDAYLYGRPGDPGDVR